MEMLATVFQGLLDLGAAVFLPIVLFIIGLIVGMKPGKAFSSALTLGVAFIGINLLIGYMGDTVGAAFTTIVEGSDSTLKYIDMGWAPALGLAWQWQYAFLMFPIQIAINVIMLLLGWTNCLNVDMWNVGNKVFTAFLVTSACNNVLYRCYCTDYRGIKECGLHEVSDSGAYRCSFCRYAALYVFK